MSDAALDPALRRALLLARDKRERRGGSGDGKVVVAELKPDEALALDGLLSVSRRRPVLPGETLRVALSTFEAALRACGLDPRREYERVGGRPLRDLPAERAARLELRSEFRSWLESHEVVQSRPLVAEWFDQACRQGRVHADMRPLVERALRVVGALPAVEPVQRTVLAAKLVDGDPHALDVGTPLHGLTVSLLEAAAELDPDIGARAVWSAWNVVVDPISSNVAVLNLPVRRRGRGRGACRASPWDSPRPDLRAAVRERPAVAVRAPMLQLREPVGADRGRAGARRGVSAAGLYRRASVRRGPAAVLLHPPRGCTRSGTTATSTRRACRSSGTSRIGTAPYRGDSTLIRYATRSASSATPRQAVARRPLRTPSQELSKAVPEELLIEALVSDLTSA